MYDVIVVGARCAGATTAMLLARKGHRVLLVDRNTFPSDLVLSNHLFWQPGTAQLKRWGLLDDLVRAGCPGMTTGSIDVGPCTLTGQFPPADGVREAYAPRRKILDGILVEAATKSGAELWAGWTVDELLVTDGTDDTADTADSGPHVGGVRGHRSAGRTFSANAAVVVAADGMRSPLAGMLEAPK